MTKMTVLFSCCLFACLAHAGTKEEAQAEIDKGKMGSCEVTKTQMQRQTKHCQEEADALAKIDCKEVKSYKLDAIFAFNKSCMDKTKAAAASGSAGAGSGRTSGTPTAKKPSSCKGLDATGALLAEETAEGSAIACQKKLKETLAKTKCDGSVKKYEFQFIGQFMGKDLKPSKATIFCPKS